jgi:putative addiction module CopG family antidote
MPTRNVNLTESFDVFIDEQIEAARYRNASEVMRAGLRLLQQQTAEDGAKLAALRRLPKMVSISSTRAAASSSHLPWISPGICRWQSDA